MARVITDIPRTEADTVRELGRFGVATVHEAQARTGLLHPRLRPIYRPAHIAGTALTCETAPGDNWMLHVAVEQAQPGDVLIVTPTSACTDGYFGELLATSLRAHGVIGLIIDAGVRDIAELTKMEFPVWSAAVSAQGTVKKTLGNVQTRITCAGVSIDPGDVIVADDDGVIVVPRSRASDVVDAATRREEKEAAVRTRLASGELGLDIYDMRARLTGEGLRYEPHPTDSTHS